MLLRFITETTQNELSQYQEKVGKSRKPENIPVPKPPPIDVIPDWWTELYDAVVIIRNFTNAVEGDLVFQQDLWKAYCDAENSFAEIEETNIFAKNLHLFFNQRFVETCNIDVAHLAHVLTADGLRDFRDQFQIETDDFYREMATLKSILSVIASKAFSKDEISDLCILGSFDWYIRNAEFDRGENLYSYWRQMKLTSFTEKGTNKGNPVSLKPFAEIASIIVTMPCTEAVCERAFSQMKTVLTDLNCNLSSDMFIAITTIKLAMKYKRNYE